MKHPRTHHLYSIALLVIAGGMVIHAPLTVWLGSLWPHYALVIKAWKEIIMLVLVLAAVVIVTRQKLWYWLASNWIVRIAAAYSVLHLVMASVFFAGWQAMFAGLAVDLRYVMFFGLVLIAVHILPACRQAFIWVSAVGAAIVGGFAVIELFLPADFLKLLGYNTNTIAPYLTVDKNPHFIRFNSTLRGPNPLGAYAGMVMIIITAALAKLRLPRTKRLTLIMLMLASAVALWVSYSRSALVAWVIAEIVVLLVVFWRRVTVKTGIVVAVAVVFAATVFLLGSGNNVVSNVLLHENPNGGSSVSSNEGHLASLATGLDLFIHQPLGAGVGSTGSASLSGSSPVIIENQYLFIAHEVGWLGLALFGVLFVTIMWRLWQRREDWWALGVFASGICAALIGLVLPVWVDDTVSMLWWGAAATALEGGLYAGKTKQKAKRTP